MDSKITLSQITSLTTLLIELSLSDQQNFPTTSGTPEGEFEITVKNATSLTAALKNVPYNDIYYELDQANCYNFKMLDGALIALRYRFSKGRIREHSLAFFPSPNLEQFQNDPQLYWEDAIYADIIAKNVVPFPIRFDFNSDPERFVEYHHSYSHLTLGQYQNCRIPVCSPVGPFTFGAFILRNFYNTAYKEISDRIPASTLLFSNTITPKERDISHLVLGKSESLVQRMGNWLHSK